MQISSATRTTRSKKQQRRLAARSDGRRIDSLAYLVAEGQSQGFTCTVNSIARNEADLTVAGLLGIPDRFSLYVEPESVKYDCVVALRKGNAVRVTLTGREENRRFRGPVGRR